MRKPKRKFNEIRAVIVMCSATLVFNMHGLVAGLLDVSNKSMIMTVRAVEPTIMSSQNVYSEMQNAMDLSIDLREDICSYEGVEIERKVVPFTRSEEQVGTVVESIPIHNNHGEYISTSEVTIYIEPLLELFYEKDENPEWDTKDKIDTLQVLWEFLVEQQGIPPENVAGILGNIYAEGHFAEQQGTGLYIADIEQARVLLGSGKVGYGCAQWTYRKRQDSLLDYYELAYELFPNDWDAVRITAECCMLLEECKAYEVFEDIYIATTLEDAVGRVAVVYESYDGCKSQWSRSNGLYHLIEDSGSGATRLRYANSIYNYFME